MSAGDLTGIRRRASAVAMHSTRCIDLAMSVDMTGRFTILPASKLDNGQPPPIILGGRLGA